ncbi:MAG: type II secretion system F family protein [Pyrinomonadaceae bacterium]|nr:type II secretion system F family protein [Phycisphaerales bacterium]
MSQVAASNAFAFLAAGPGGRKKFGVRQARNIPALADSLRSENRILLKYWRLPKWASREATLSLSDHATLNDQLGQLLTRGVPLVEALEVTAATVRSSAKPRILRMRELVASGASFANACRTVGGFDNVTIAVYQGAERTGDLAGAAKQLAETARRQLKVTGKAATLMIYPAIVLSISAVVALIMMTIVVPLIGEGLSRADIKLPWISQLVMTLGAWMKENITFLLMGFAVAMIVLFLCRGFVLLMVQKFMRRAPLIRDVVMAQEAARFFSVMAAMTRTGVPMADALAVANQAVNHPALLRQLQRLRTRLIEGGLLKTLIEEVSQFPISTRRLLIAAERSGDMESAFTMLAGDMTDEVDRRAGRLLAVMEPLLIVLMFLIIGSLLMAILLPMLTLTNKIGA